MVLVPKTTGRRGFLHNRSAPLASASLACKHNASGNGVDLEVNQLTQGCSSIAACNQMLVFLCAYNSGNFLTFKRHHQLQWGGRWHGKTQVCKRKLVRACPCMSPYDEQPQPHASATNAESNQTSTRRAVSKPTAVAPVEAIAAVKDMQ